MFVMILCYITSFLLSSAKHGIEKKIRNNIHRAVVWKCARICGGCHLKLA